MKIIVHNLNILEITPVDNKFVSRMHPLLSYDHRGMVYEGNQQRMEVERRNLYQYDEDRKTLVVPQGLLKRVKDALEEDKEDYEYLDMRDSSKLQEPNYENLWKEIPSLKFRYKQDMIVALLTLIDMGQIVAPAGFGKTFLIMCLCALYPEAKILVATPGTDLVRDTVERLTEVFGKDVGQAGGGKNTADKRIVVSTYQSIHKVMNDRDIILVDEVHKAAAPTLAKELTEKNKAVKMFGFTASPVGRSDNAELVTESLLGPVALQVTYQDAVENGLVAPMKVVLLPVERGVASSDYSTKVAKERNLYWRNVYRNKVIANAIPHYIKEFNLREDAQVLVLVDKVDHAMRLQKYMPDYTLVYSQPGRTGLDTMNVKKRKQLLEDFKSGKLRKVIATSCWGTGIDVPELDMVVQATGGASEINTIQYGGRGTRTNNGQKAFGIVLDCNDTWDPWAKRRANERRKVYKSLGWTIFG